MIQAYNTETGYWVQYAPASLDERDAILARLRAGPYGYITVNGRRYV